MGLSASCGCSKDEVSKPDREKGERPLKRVREDSLSSSYPSDNEGTPPTDIIERSDEQFVNEYEDLDDIDTGSKSLSSDSVAIGTGIDTQPTDGSSPLDSDDDMWDKPQSYSSDQMPTDGMDIATDSKEAVAFEDAESEEIEFEESAKKSQSLHKKVEEKTVLYASGKSLKKLDESEVKRLWIEALTADDCDTLRQLASDFSDLRLQSFVFAMQPPMDEEMTSLMHAIASGNLKCVEYLIESDLANVDFQRASDGRNALHVAVTCNLPRVVERLLTKGFANPLLIDFNGDMPLDIAVWGGLAQCRACLEAVAPALADAIQIATITEDGSGLAMIAEESKSEFVEEVETEETLPSKTVEQTTALSTDEDSKEDDTAAVLLVSTTVTETSTEVKKESTVASSRIARSGRKRATAAGSASAVVATIAEQRASKEVIRQMTEDLGHAPAEVKEMEQTYAKKTSEARSKLPLVEGWIEKKSPKAPYRFQKRWVIIRDGFMLWNDKQRTLGNGRDAKERGEFKGQLNLLHVSEVRFRVKQSAAVGNKFEVVALDPRKAAKGKSRQRTYVWRTPSKEDCRFWVKSMLQHKKYISDLLKTLSEPTFDM